MNHDINNVGLAHTFPPGKIYWKKYYWEKINIDIIKKKKKLKKLIDRSIDPK